MVDPTGIVVGVLTQVISELADDLLDSATAPRPGARLVDRPIRLDRRLAGSRRLRYLDQDGVGRLVGELERRLRPLRAGVPDGDWQAALDAVAESLGTLAPLTVELVVEQTALRPQRLEAVVRRRSAAVLRAAGLGEAALAVYDRALAEGCAQVVDFVTARPEFAARAQVQVVREVADQRVRTGELRVGVEEVRVGLDDLATAPARASRAARTDFEQRYAEVVRASLDTLELFGVTLRSTPHRWRLGVGYTALSAVRAGLAPGEEDPELTAGIRADAIPTAGPRVLLRGTAGAGKTTVLHRIAVSAADLLARDAGAEPAPVVPFLIPLRRYVSRDLPRPDGFLDAVAPSLAGAHPPGWADSVLREGRALVLVDGVDELPSAAPSEASGLPRTLRPEAGRWLRDLVLTYPRSRFVVTTRLSAVRDDWLADDGFRSYDLLPMGERGVRDLIERWHDAALAECEPEERERLERYRQSLPDILSDRPELLRLAATPLLCALVCALNRDRRMELPRDRIGLYDAALDMLLDRRDPARGVTAPEGLSFDPREQAVLLQRLAYHLVRNEVSDIAADDAVAQVGRALEGIRTRDASPAQVYRHLLTRTGLLRADPLSGRVHFVHRTFQDYLGSREAVDCGDLPLLGNRAHDDQWRDVVVMAAAHARPRECGTLLAALLDRARQEPALRERLHLVAAAAAEQAAVIEPPELRARVTRAAAELLPPASAEAADGLARLGDFVLDLLPGPAGLAPDRAALVVRVAALVGTPAARRVISRFLASPEPVVLNELLRAWQRAPDAEDYARTVLADIDFGQHWVSVRRHRLPYLRHVPGVRALRHRGDLVDLEPFADLPALSRLELMQNDVLRDRHLAPLVGCAVLRELRLVFCPLVTDLSVLAELPLEHLTVHFLTRLDLATLASFGSLHSLSVRGVRDAEDLARIPAELPLRRLAFGGRLPTASLRGLDRWPGLEELSLVGVPAADDLAALAALPALRLLVVDGLPPEQAPALDPLRAARPGLAVRVQVDPPARPDQLDGPVRRRPG